MTMLVLTVVGDDRTGLVEALSGAITEHGGNWEQSRMAHLGEKFAGVLLVRAPDDRVEALTRAFEMIEADGLLHLHVERSAEPASEPGTRRRLRLAVVGQDRPGIVHDISHALAVRGVGIEELETEARSGSVSGGTLFHARAVLDVPASLDVDALSDALEAFGNELMVDLDVERDESQPPW